LYRSFGNLSGLPQEYVLLDSTKDDKVSEENEMLKRHRVVCTLM
jgi:hypothetical protein